MKNGNVIGPDGQAVTSPDGKESVQVGSAAELRWFIGLDKQDQIRYMSERNESGAAGVAYGDGHEPGYVTEASGETVVDREGVPVKKGTFEELLWLASHSDEMAEDYVSREEQAGRTAAPEAQQGSDAPRFVTLNGKQAATKDGKPIPVGGLEELKWAAANLSAFYIDDYVAQEQKAGRPKIGYDVAGPDTNGFVRAPDGALAEYAGNPIKKGSVEEVIWYMGLGPDSRDDYIANEEKLGRSTWVDPTKPPAVVKPEFMPNPHPEDDRVYDLEGDPAEDENGNDIYKDTNLERKWFSGLSPVEQEAYLARERSYGRELDLVPEGAASRIPQPLTGSGTTRGDMKDYEDVVNETPLQAGYTCQSRDGGRTYDYDGPLGTFSFDPKEFALAVVSLPENEFGSGCECMALKYIGEETDGRKIHVPEGVRDASYMFSGTDLRRAPQLPDSVEIAMMTYMSCPRLKDASASLPAHLTDASFMFSDCAYLGKGPAHLPDELKYADYMFSDDPKLRNAPTIGSQVTSMDGAFAFCRSLNTPPKVPVGAKFSAVDMTYGCDFLDEKKDERDQKRFEKDRARADKRAHSIGVIGQMGSMCAAVAQFHAMRQRGCNVISAAYQVYKGRKEGSLGRNFSDAQAALTKDSRKRARYLRNSQLREQEREHSAAMEMRDWDNMHAVGSKITKDVRRLALNGKRDFESGLFERITTKSSTELRGYAYTRQGKGGIYDELKYNLQQQFGDMVPSAKQKKEVVDFFLERASENSAYCASARSAILSGTRGELTKRSMAGMEIAAEQLNEPLVRTMQDIQASYQVFNDNDKRKINTLMAGMGYEGDIFAEADATTRNREAVGKGARVEYLTPDQFNTRPAESVKHEEASKPAEEKVPGPSRDEKAPEGDRVTPDAGKAPAEPEGMKPVQDGEVFKEIGENAKSAGIRAAKAAGTAAMAFFDRVRASAAAAATAFVEYSKLDVPAPEAEKDESRSVSSYQDGAVNKDVESAAEQAKVDEAASLEQMEDTANRIQQEKAKKKIDPDQIRKDIDRMKDVGRSGEEKDGRDITD